MDHIGEILQPEDRPRKGTMESQRNVISNIHRGGTPPIEAGAHIGTLLKKMLEQQTSGVNLVV